ncbi:protein PRRC2C-like [Drosophila sulfurigaster albostrigata]|uniref:protein PRRC2C-like n=1 Tax=Drosophila sulfurigaster albostrigata TaxID=89887 RepID=UPI002D21E8F3|nr:protein PRRC2C-like [Drosophila sulfurigaster albostrigata]
MSESKANVIDEHMLFMSYLENNYELPSGLKNDIIYCQRAMRDFLMVHTLVSDVFTAQGDADRIEMQRILDELEQEIYEVNAEQTYLMLQIEEDLDKFYKWLQQLDVAIVPDLANAFISSQIVPLIADATYIIAPNSVKMRDDPETLIRRYFLILADDAAETAGNERDGDEINPNEPLSLEKLFTEDELPLNTVSEVIEMPSDAQELLEMFLAQDELQLSTVSSESVPQPEDEEEEEEDKEEQAIQLPTGYAKVPSVEEAAATASITAAALGVAPTADGAVSNLDAALPIVAPTPIAASSPIHAAALGVAPTAEGADSNLEEDAALPIVAPTPIAASSPIHAASPNIKEAAIAPILAPVPSVAAASVLESSTDADDEEAAAAPIVAPILAAALSGASNARAAVASIEKAAALPIAAAVPRVAPKETTSKKRNWKTAGKKVAKAPPTVARKKPATKSKATAGGTTSNKDSSDGGQESFLNLFELCTHDVVRKFYQRHSKRTRRLIIK